jgi:hypothetical protein
VLARYDGPLWARYYWREAMENRADSTCHTDWRHEIFWGFDRRRLDIVHYPDFPKFLVRCDGYVFALPYGGFEWAINL